MELWPGLPRRRVWWFVVLSPAALLAAWLLLPWVDGNARLNLRLGPQEAIEKAQAVLAEMGLDTAGWPARVTAWRDEADELERYLRLHEDEAPEDVALARRLAPPLTLRVRFETLRETEAADVFFAPDGELLGYDLRLRGETADALVRAADPGTDGFAPPPAPVAAEVALRQWLGDELYEELGLERPVTESTQGGDGRAQEADGATEEDSASDENSESEVATPGTQRFVWRPQLEQLPDLKLRLRMRLRDGVVFSRVLEAEVDDATAAQFGWGSGGVAFYTFAWACLVLAGFAFLFFGLWRYVERVREAEVSHGRTALLGAVVGSVACLVTYYMITGYRLDREIGLDSSLELLLALLVIFVLFLFAGLFLGLVWAGCEGDVRQGYSGKLISLDALLAGRFVSPNLARTLIVAAACAGWLMLARCLLLLPWAGDAAAGPLLSPDQLCVLHPWQNALSRAFAFLVPYVPLLLLAPLALMRWWNHRRSWILTALTILAWTACWANPVTGFARPVGLALLESALWAAALIGPFVVFDLLTSVFTYAASMLVLRLLYVVHQPAPALQQAALEIAGAAVLVLGAAVLALRYGQEVSQEEVLPGYARNMLERAALSAELSAAREAQGQLLPSKAPPVPGAALSACCAPDWEAEGEYFDYFPLPGERLGFAFANFGHSGLAAALSMALSKGFLLSYSWRDLPPREALSRLVVRLQELVEEAQAASLLYAVYRPGAPSVLQLAHARRSPLIVRLRPNEAPQVLAGPMVATNEAAESDGQERDAAAIRLQEIPLAPGDRLVFAHLEDADWQQRRSRHRRRLNRALSRTRAEEANALLGELRRQGLTVGMVLLLRVDAEVPEVATLADGKAAEVAA